MRPERLRGCPEKRYRVTTRVDPSYPIAKNLLKRNFQAEASTQRWVADITYVPNHRFGWIWP
jgi:transposase InsO family protein